MQQEMSELGWKVSREKQIQVCKKGFKNKRKNTKVKHQDSFACLNGCQAAKARASNSKLNAFFCLNASWKMNVWTVSRWGFSAVSGEDR